MSEREYRVRWEIDVLASSPYAAAKKAREAQARPDTMATALDVHERGGGQSRWEIDLSFPTESGLLAPRSVPPMRCSSHGMQTHALVRLESSTYLCRTCDEELTDGGFLG